MKRKVAASFGKSNRERLKPPYLTNEEVSEFQMEFTLFGECIDLKQLQAVALARNNKLLVEFLGELLQKDTKLTFEAYLQEIQQFLNDKSPPERNDVMFQLLDENAEGKLSLDRFRSIMRETGETPLSEEEAGSMLTALTGSNAKCITREQFCALLASKPLQP